MERKDKMRRLGVGKLSDVAQETLSSSTADEAVAEDRVPTVEETVAEGHVPSRPCGETRPQP